MSPLTIGLNCLINGDISEEERVKITVFASFKPHQKPERTGRNPKTGKEVLIITVAA
ncbi:MAG: hypothetical protein HOI46_07235 [Rhodospirillaceae bacterium]|nr:hypothetical protein [Rhodospirillaceae bacterium]